MASLIVCFERQKSMWSLKSLSLVDCDRAQIGQGQNDSSSLVGGGGTGFVAGFWKPTELLGPLYVGSGLGRMALPCLRRRLDSSRWASAVEGSDLSLSYS